MDNHTKKIKENKPNKLDEKLKKTSTPNPAIKNLNETYNIMQTILNNAKKDAEKIYSNGKDNANRFVEETVNKYDDLKEMLNTSKKSPKELNENYTRMQTFLDNTKKDAQKNYSDSKNNINRFVEETVNNYDDLKEMLYLSKEGLTKLEPKKDYESGNKENTKNNKGGIDSIVNGSKVKSDGKKDYTSKSRKPAKDYNKLDSKVDSSKEKGTQEKSPDYKAKDSEDYTPKEKAKSPKGKIDSKTKDYQPTKKETKKDNSDKAGYKKPSKENIGSKTKDYLPNKKDEKKVDDKPDYNKTDKESGKPKETGVKKDYQPGKKEKLDKKTTPPKPGSKEGKKPSPADVYGGITNKLSEEVPKYTKGIKGALLVAQAEELKKDDHFNVEYDSDVAESIFGNLTNYVSDKMLDLKDIDLSSGSKVSADEVKEYIAEHYMGLNKERMYFEMKRLIGEQREFNADTAEMVQRELGGYIGQNTGHQYIMKALSPVKEAQKTNFTDYTADFGNQLGIKLDKSKIRDVHEAKQKYEALFNIRNGEVENKKRVEAELNASPSYNSNY